ncbi:outer membrane protein [Pararhizobium mangrovi]|nr:outer membrane beta-barrel protein [Pararhizobium mangrovi]
MPNRIKALLLAAAGCAALAAPAAAADLDSVLLEAPELPETRPVEVGTGWYLRGDVGYSLDTNNVDSDWGGTAGFGYHFNDYLRSDLTVEYNQGSSSDAIDQDFNSWGFLLNGYVDLGTYMGVTPYVGGGVGTVNVHWKGVDEPDDIETRDDDWRFAYQLSAGLAYAVTDNLKLTVGYRYLNVDGGERYQIGDEKYDDDGYTKSEIRGGLLYDIW